MVTIASLWLPILVSTVLVFIASFLIWSVLPIHKGDFRRLPSEATLLDTLRKQGAEPGLYLFPYAGDRAAMKDPEYVERMRSGPVGLLTLARPGMPSMARNLSQWFVYVLVISIFVAYLASRTVPPGAQYLEVFRVAGTVAVLAYSAAAVPAAIWFWRPWKVVAKDVLDGVVYGLLTAGVFGWLWPAA